MPVLLNCGEFSRQAKARLEIDDRKFGRCICQQIMTQGFAQHVLLMIAFLPSHKNMIIDLSKTPICS